MEKIKTAHNWLLCLLVKLTKISKKCFVIYSCKLLKCSVWEWSPTAFTDYRIEINTKIGIKIREAILSRVNVINANATDYSNEEDPNQRYDIGVDILTFYYFKSYLTFPGLISMVAVGSTDAFNGVAK